MTDLTALDELIKAVEAGEFRREMGPARYTDLLGAVRDAGLCVSSKDLVDALFAGDTVCADFLRAQLEARA